MSYEFVKENTFTSLRKVFAVGAATLAFSGCAESEGRVNELEDCLEERYGIEADLRLHPSGSHIMIPQEILEEANTCISELNSQ